MPPDYSGKRFGILGIGKSGIAAARLIQRLGGIALLSDVKSSEQIGPVVEQLTLDGFTLELGGHRRVLTEKFDFVVVSPGITLDRDWIDTWSSRGIPVISELELASLCYNGKWIAVTGSNGKTTTVTLITDILRSAGIQVQSAGNIGKAWSDFLPQDGDSVFVIEVSSFQMEHTHTARPSVAVFLNILENHLERHGDLITYGLLKLKLAANCGPEDVIVYNADDTFLSEHCRSLKATKVTFGRTCADFVVHNGVIYRQHSQSAEKVFSGSEWKLIGDHNLLNASAALAVSQCFGINDSIAQRSLRAATPVEHRIEFLGMIDGVSYINDSKSTNLAATVTAISAVKGSIILLFGGRPKQENFSSLGDLLGKDLKGLIVFGEATEKVKNELPDALSIEYCSNLEEALHAGRRLASEGDSILLSPGCASYDQYQNFEQRGIHFKTLVRNLK